LDRSIFLPYTVGSRLSKSILAVATVHFSQLSRQKILIVIFLESSVSSAGSADPAGK
jgi:hypothetical protein